MTLFLKNGVRQWSSYYFKDVLEKYNSTIVLKVQKYYFEKYSTFTIENAGFFQGTCNKHDLTWRKRRMSTMKSLTGKSCGKNS